MNSSPPHTKTTSRLPLAIVGVASFISILLFAILYLAGEKEPERISTIPDDTIINLVENTPKQKSQDGKSLEEVSLELPQGGWVQQADSEGNLSQQYRCESVDSNPKDLSKGWIRLKKPEIEIFLSDNKLVVITGDTATANAPNQVLESGSIDGHVRVEMFELHHTGGRLSETPSMVMTTPQATFDKYLGEITCASEVRIESAKHKLVGRRLTVNINDKKGRVEYLRLEELDYLDFYPEPILQPNPSTPTPITKHKTTPKDKVAPHRVHAAAAGTPVDFYFLTFSNNVTVIQGQQHSGRSATGDRLTVAFSDESESSSLAQTIPTRGTASMLPFSIQTSIIATTLAATQTPTETPPIPVRLTCDNGFTMVPLEEVSLMPDSAEDTRIELFASDKKPIQIIDNVQHLTASGSKLRHDVLQDRTNLFGSPASFVMHEMETLSDHLWIAKQDGKGGAIGSGSIIEIKPVIEGTALTWKDSIDFFFNTEGENEALERVVCVGNVVLSDQGSTVLCDSLTVQFEEDETGSPAPSTAHATGGVKAISETQTMWANDAVVTFESTDGEEAAEGAMFSGSKAKKMKANGDVQVLLDDGGRAFCDTLEGNINQDIAVLKGNVVIAYQRMLMNRGDRASLTLDRSSGKGKWLGSGQALFLDTPIDVSPDSRIERPEIFSKNSPKLFPINISMRANWETEMNLDRDFNDQAGAVDLSGGVNVRTTKTPLDLSQMSGEDLRLEFDLVQNELNNEERQLKKVIAKNNAAIDHKLWDALAPDTDPVEYNIAGNHVEFDATTLDVLAVGDGQLVVHDTRKPKPETHQSALAGRGTTMFTWTKKLKTTQLSKDLYLIVMDGDVSMAHKGLDGNPGVLTAHQIEAIAMNPNDVKTKEDGTSELLVRGMDLQQLKALGNVYVSNGTRTVNCDSFDYNLRTGIAQLQADEGKTIEIVTSRTPYPVRASSVVWNMDPADDRITIMDLQSSSPN
jgi:lipopolysaccharide export system protein LptA